MEKGKHRSENENKLIRRYLIWCYKTTKEDLDRTDRYFTQFEADQYMLDQLTSDEYFKSSKAKINYKKLIDDFNLYLNEKKSAADKKKYSNIEEEELSPDYLYLLNRLSAIENAIVHFLGKEELNNIQFLYEEEMTRRILQARDHT